MSYPHFNHSLLYCCFISPLGIAYNSTMGYRFVVLRLLLGLLSFDASCHHCFALAFAPITALPREIRPSLTSPELFTAGPRCSSLFQPQGRGQWRSTLAGGWGAGITRWTGTVATSRGRGGLCMAKESLILTEENVIAVLAEAKQELSTLFGNSKENAAVGITGDVEFVGLEGPTAVVRLTGRFWHEKTTVLSRVANFVMTRIPECVDVEVDDPAQLEDADPPAANVKAPEI